MTLCQDIARGFSLDDTCKEVCLDTAIEHGHLDSMPRVFAALHSITQFESLRACVFRETGVVVSELLKSLPNLNELVCLSCINVFDKTNISYVQSWHFFDGNQAQPLSRLEVQLIHDEDELTIDSDTSSKPQTGGRVAHKRTISASRLAVWTRTRLSSRQASHFKDLPSSSSTTPATCFDDKESKLVDAVSLYGQTEDYVSVAGTLFVVFVSLLNCENHSSAASVLEPCVV